MTAAAPTAEWRPLALAGTFGTGVLASAGLGAFTNSVNGAVSPTYFVRILRWHDVENVWRASIAQGVFEGILYGLFFSLVLTSVIGVVSRGRCPYGFAAGHLTGVFGATLLCWVLGGLIGVGLSALSPEFYRRAFIGVPEDPGEMCRYAWVGGSIWGAVFGGLACVILGAILFVPRWRRYSAAAGREGAGTAGVAARDPGVAGG